MFVLINFCGFCSIRKNFLTVNGYNMDQHLESSERLVYYQVTGEPGIADCSRRSDIYILGGCGVYTHTYSLIIAT